MCDAFNIQHSRANAGRQNHQLKATGRQLSRAGSVIQPKLDAGQLDLTAEIAQRLLKFFLARNLLCDIELATDFRRGFK